MRLPKLSGSDYFHLLLDRKMLRNELVGNISRIRIELNPNCSLAELESKLGENQTLKKIANLKYINNWPALPKWSQRDSVNNVLQVHSGLSQSDFD